MTSAGRATGAPIDGALVEKQVTGTEVILGAIRDRTFGPMVLVGIGGVVAEALNDIRMALAPVTRLYALQLIQSLAGVGILTHPRTGAPANVNELASLLVLLGDHLAADSTITAIDLNPVAWTGSNWLVLDAVIER